ncbi:M23 family metallopeptidase [Piscibacillus halophilus]|uniref:Stage II sporulation protein Q n=1 Tax=Piscibacillus halophilus TaxID=571933 RepID=A0A1H9KIB9_9BACI|nr:M23 family metallopeptidase [Piscibacillus halophilus]SEQ98886.1 stage II sporulation protein Q [Piscibacillus halophilus]
MNEKERQLMRQSKWKRLTRQRWFYPALYITLVAVILAGVMVYQFQASDVTEDGTQNEENPSQVADNNGEEESVPVVADQEDLVMPTLLGDQAEIITKFYDAEASEEEQEDALIFYNNTYRQSKGVDITSKDGQPFEVIAALSGTVTSVYDDDLEGQVVEIEHDESRSTYYGSLSEVSVDEGDEVTQGDVIGVSGTNVYGDEEVTKVHFRLLEDGEPVNPEFE